MLRTFRLVKEEVNRKLEKMEVKLHNMECHNLYFSQDVSK
jgi:hypothetical protein